MEPPVRAETEAPADDVLTGPEPPRRGLAEDRNAIGLSSLDVKPLPAQQGDSQSPEIIRLHPGVIERAPRVARGRLFSIQRHLGPSPEVVVRRPRAGYRGHTG